MRSDNRSLNELLNFPLNYTLFMGSSSFVLSFPPSLIPVQCRLLGSHFRPQVVAFNYADNHGVSESLNGDYICWKSSSFSFSTVLLFASWKLSSFPHTPIISLSLQVHIVAVTFASQFRCIFILLLISFGGLTHIKKERISLAGWLVGVVAESHSQRFPLWSRRTRLTGS